MFVVSIRNQIFFHDDPQDILSLCMEELEESQIPILQQWLIHAHFQDEFRINDLFLVRISELQARKMASFYQMLPAFEKIYGKAV